MTTTATTTMVLHNSLQMLAQGSRILEEGDFGHSEYIFKSVVSSLTKHMRQHQASSHATDGTPPTAIGHVPAPPLVALPTAVVHAAEDDPSSVVPDWIAAGSTVLETSFVVTTTWGDELATNTMERAVALTGATCMYNLAWTYQRQSREESSSGVLQQRVYWERAHKLYSLAWSAVRNVLIPHNEIADDEGVMDSATTMRMAPLDDASWLLMLAIGLNAHACAEELLSSSENWMQAVGRVLELLEPGPLSDTSLFQYIHLVWFCHGRRARVAVAA